MTLLEIMREVLKLAEGTQHAYVRFFYVCYAFQQVTNISFDREETIKDKYPEYHDWIVYHNKKSWKDRGGLAWWGMSWNYDLPKKIRLIKYFIKKLEKKNDN